MKSDDSQSTTASTNEVFQLLEQNKPSVSTTPKQPITALEIIDKLGKWCQLIYQVDSLMRQDAFNDTFFLENKIDWETVYHYCKKHGLEAQDIYAPWQLVAFIGDVEIIKKYLEKNPNFLTQQDRYFRRTPLHYAAWGGHVEAVKFLLDKGVLNTSNEPTPLHYARRVDATEVIKVLTPVHETKENQSVIAEEKESFCPCVVS